MPFAKDPKSNRKANILVRELVPPIRFTVYNEVAELSVDKPSLPVPAGSKVPLTVKVKRLYDYKGEFQVQLVLPNGFGGVSSAAVKIPANANQAQLIITAAANAKPASNPNVVIRAVGRVGNTNLTSETKINLAITEAKGG
jgi:hypothetical protein